MAISPVPLEAVVIDNPAERIKDLLQEPIPSDVFARSEILKLLNQNQEVVDKKQLASYLTASINMDYQDPDVIALSYEVARKVFKGLNLEGFEADRSDVSIFSDQPVKHAVCLDKKEILRYHLNKEELRFEEIDGPLADYLCTHTVPEASVMLIALYEKNPKFFNQFFQTHLNVLRNGLGKTDECCQITIDQFLELVQFNQVYQTVFAHIRTVKSDVVIDSPKEEAKCVMAITHAKCEYIMQSLSSRLDDLESQVKKATAKEKLLELKNTLESLDFRLEMAKDFLMLNTSLEKEVTCLEKLKGQSWKIFERSKPGYKTDLNFVKELLQEVNKKLKAPEKTRKRLASEDLQPVSKAAHVEKRKGDSYCTIL